MGLRDWHIDLDRDTCTLEDAGACYTIVSGRKYVEISFGPAWDTYDLEKQRHILVHELVHIHTNAMDTATDWIKARLSPDVYGVWWEGFRDALEHGVDGI